MKKMMILLIIATLPAIASYNCRTTHNNPYHSLQPVACACDCTNRYSFCPKCSHHQEARPLTLINKTDEKMKLRRKHNFPMTLEQFALYAKKYKTKHTNPQIIEK